MKSDYDKIKQAIQNAKHLTDSERDALISMLWQEYGDDNLTTNIKALRELL